MAEAQRENRVAEDLTMIVVVSFQIRSLMVRDRLTEEKEDEVVADTTTMIDDLWTMASQEADSTEEVTAVQMVSNTAATVRESTTVTASIATKRAISPSTAALHQDQEVMGGTEVALEVTITIGMIDQAPSTVSDPAERLRTSLLK